MYFTKIEQTKQTDKQRAKAKWLLASVEICSGRARTGVSTPNQQPVTVMRTLDSLSRKQ